MSPMTSTRSPILKFAIIPLVPVPIPHQAARVLHSHAIAACSAQIVREYFMAQSINGACRPDTDLVSGYVLVKAREGPHFLGGASVSASQRSYEKHKSSRRKSGKFSCIQGEKHPSLTGKDHVGCHRLPLQLQLQLQ